MARPKIKSATDQRPFIMVYQDFLESDLLDNHYQKLVYVYLKKFADSKNQCFPSVKTLSKLTKISVNKVKLTLAELEKKGVISKENRTRPDGGKSSNLYTLYDFKELWDAGSSEEVATVVDEYEDKKLISLLEAKGYTVIKEKELESEPTKAQTQALELNQYDMVNNIIKSNECQVMERYTHDQIRHIFELDYILLDYPNYKTDVSTVENILYDVMNTSKPTVRIVGEDKPTRVVIGKLMKLDYSEIMYCIEKYNEQTERIKNPTAYMLTLLYNAKEQMNLDISNQVQHDMYHWEPPTE